jgi:hypothetical protein
MSALVQPFPKHGVLSDNLNLTTTELNEKIGHAREAAYSYIVKTVRMDRTSRLFEQHGSAPNFQGGCLTLCTCKHQMRSSLNVPQWQHKWVAGFTSRCLYQGRHWLFFLSRVEAAHDSHADLWAHLPSAVRNAKSTQKHFLGDLFRPRGKVTKEDRFNPRLYFTPSRHSHRRNSCDNVWHNDIDYAYADRYGRPALLAGGPHLTFLWERPVAFLVEDHCRNYKKWGSVTELLGHLECGT